MPADCKADVTGWLEISGACTLLLVGWGKANCETGAGCGNVGFWVVDGGNGAATGDAYGDCPKYEDVNGEDNCDWLYIDDDMGDENGDWAKSEDESGEESDDWPNSEDERGEESDDCPNNVDENGDERDCCANSEDGIGEDGDGWPKNCDVVRDGLSGPWLKNDDWESGDENDDWESGDENDDWERNEGDGIGDGSGAWFMNPGKGVGGIGGGNGAPPVKESGEPNEAKREL